MMMVNSVILTDLMFTMVAMKLLMSTVVSMRCLGRFLMPLLTFLTW